jgi:alpha,alpha-trehalase
MGVCRDTYFVIQGLLLSDLDDLARDMIQNLLDFVDIYGFMRKCLADIFI